MCYVWVFYLHACRRNSCVSGVCGSQKDTGSLDLEWQMAVIHHVNFRRQTLGARTLLLQEEWVFLTTEPSLLAHHPVWFLLFKRKMYPLFSGNLVYRHIEFMFMIKTENALINFILHNIYISFYIYLSPRQGWCYPQWFGPSYINYQFWKTLPQACLPGLV